jgi:hypothetical protein
MWRNRDGFFYDNVSIYLIVVSWLYVSNETDSENCERCPIVPGANSKLSHVFAVLNALGDESENGVL